MSAAAKKRKTRAAEDADYDNKKKVKTHTFPWSVSYDVNICALWDCCNGKPQHIAKLMLELGISPCPTYDQVRSRITTEEFKDTQSDWIESKLIFYC